MRNHSIFFSLLALILVLSLSFTALAEGAGSFYTSGDLFTSRDLNQQPDLTDAVYYTVSDGNDISITAAGTYVLSGTASSVTVRVEATSEEYMLRGGRVPFLRDMARSTLGMPWPMSPLIT